MHFLFTIPKSRVSKTFLTPKEGPRTCKEGLRTLKEGLRTCKETHNKSIRTPICCHFRPIPNRI